jgi:hypothetical protein
MPTKAGRKKASAPNKAMARLFAASVPNVTHRDIGAKLAFGRWNYTATGLLDHTHLRLFDHGLLTAVLEKAGLFPIDAHDIVQVVGDQHFPSAHPALNACTSLGGLVFDLASRANSWANTYQFVWLCTPSREVDRQTFVTEREEARPFLSVIIRTQGKRLHTLMEALTCLSGQTDTDFEAIVVGHKLAAEGVESVKSVIDDTPDWIRAKVRLILAEGGGRARPLNVGFAAARGRYIAILDDDDIPFGHWIEEYRKLDATTPGRVLRNTSVRQNVTNVAVSNRIALRSEGAPERCYPPEFDFLNHLVDNFSPNNTLAFPRGAFHDLGLRFDETLDTTEDWDFLLQAAAYCGVASSPEITGVYRWWINHESSATLHRQDEWRSNRLAILRKQDQNYLILPKGEAAKIRQLIHDHTDARAALTELRGAQERSARERADQERAHQEQAAQERAHQERAYQDRAAQERAAQERAYQERAAQERADQERNKRQVAGRLDSLDDAIECGRELRGVLPWDLERSLRKGLRREIMILKLKALLSFHNRKKRKAYENKRRIYRQFIRAFH